MEELCNKEEAREVFENDPETVRQHGKEMAGEGGEVARVFQKIIILLKNEECEGPAAIGMRMPAACTAGEVAWRRINN